MAPRVNPTTPYRMNIPSLSLSEDEGSDQEPALASSPPSHIIRTALPFEQQLLELDSKIQEMVQTFQDLDDRIKENRRALKAVKIECNKYAERANLEKSTERDQYYAQLNNLWLEASAISENSQIYYHNPKTGEMEPIGSRTALRKIITARKVQGIPSPKGTHHETLLAKEMKKGPSVRKAEAQIKLKEIDQKALEIMKQIEVVDASLPFKEEWDAANQRYELLDQNRRMLAAQMSYLIQEKGSIERQRSGIRELLMQKH